MSDKKLIAVIGATGAQGGGLVRAILADPNAQFRVRGITRNPESENALALIALGAEMVSADLDDVASLTAAFDGCYGAYCVTNFWEHFSPEKEIQQAQNLAKAAKAAGISHAIWSTLDDTRKSIPLDDDRMPTLMDHYKVPHFDAKGASDHFFTYEGVPTTFLLTSFYWDNLIAFGMEPQRGEDGKLVFTLPTGDTKMPAIAAEDIGKCAFGVFAAGDKYIGQTVGISGAHVSGPEMAAALSETLGEPVTHFAVPFDMYRGFGFPGAGDLGNMFQFYHDFNDDFRASRSTELARQLNPNLQDFQAFLSKNGSRIPRH
jgi:uncharacterized protein YbjT (DUF2867 family)